MPPPRGIEERIKWFQSNNPSKSGMCAQHTWRSLGGDYGNPPPWGAPSANSCISKIIAAGRYWTPQTWNGAPPRGAWVGWKYGEHGHAAVGDGKNWKINTTDPSGNQGMCGIEPLDYPKKWGFNTSKGPYTLWTDQYNGVRFEVGVDVADAWEYHYSGKPSGTLTVGTSYKRLDCSAWNPSRVGIEFAMVYLNVKPTFKSGKTIGSLRIRSVRADGDASAYHDYVIAQDALEDGGQLITHVYFEKGDGKATYYELRCQGGLASVAIGTRYRKGAVDY